MSTTITDTAIKRVCVINRLSSGSQMDQNKEIIPALQAIQKQLNEEFKHYWGLGAKLYYAPPGVQAPNNMWSCFLMDTSDIAGAAGYHDANDQGIPQSKTFVKTIKQHGGQWSVTLDHEILEMLVDPWGQLSFFQDFTSGTRRLVVVENCDMTEADKYGYKKDGILLSNFATPYWWHAFKDVAEYDNVIKYDYRGIINESFKTLPGCHQSYYYISGAPRGVPINKWSSKTFNLGEVQEIFAPQPNGYVIEFKTPTHEMVEKYKIDKEEVVNAIHDAFNPPEGSRRAMRFKGYKHLQTNTVKETDLKPSEGNIIQPEDY